MNREIRNDHQITVHIHETACNALLGANDNSTCDRERFVEPRRKKQSTIFLHIEFYIGLVHLNLRIRLDLECRRIAVARHDLKSDKIPFRNLKCDQRRVISRHIVTLSRL